jgi:hypothetical protein
MEAIEAGLIIGGVLLLLWAASNWNIRGSIFGAGGMRHMRRRIRAWFRRHSSLHRMRHERRMRIKRAAFEDMLDQGRSEVDRMLANASFLMNQAAEWQARRERP